MFYFNETFLFMTRFYKRSIERRTNFRFYFIRIFLFTFRKQTNFLIFFKRRSLTLFFRTVKRVLCKICVVCERFDINTKKFYIISGFNIELLLRLPQVFYLAMKAFFRFKLVLFF